LNKHSEEYDELKELLEYYTDSWYLYDEEYNDFIGLKIKIQKELYGSKTTETNKIDNLQNSQYIVNEEDAIIRIPCPHCSFLCLPNVKYCMQCGEPIPSLKNGIKIKAFQESETETVKIVSSGLKKRKQIKSDDVLYKKFKEVQQKGRIIQKKYQNEIKIKKKAKETLHSVNQEVIKKSQVQENVWSNQIEKNSQIENHVGSVVKSYIYRKEGNFIKLYNKSNHAFELKISIDAFKNKEGGLYKCDCGMSFFSVNDLVKHIVRKSKCLDHYITYVQTAPRESITIDTPRINSIKSKIQKAKFIFLNNNYHKLEDCNFVIDGANVAREGTKGKNGGIISNFHMLFDKLRSFQIENYLIICDRSLNYTIDDPKEYSELIKTGKIIETPGGTEADHFILKYAKNNDAFIISNDLFKEFEFIFGKEWIRSKRISFKIINDKLYFDKIYTTS